MKAWLLNRIGSLNDLQIGNLTDPTPAPGEAVVGIQFAGLNPADHYLMVGQYPTKASFPHIAGRDGLGIIDSVGLGVSAFKPGDKVLLLRSEVGVSRRGSFAEKVAVPVESLAAVPRGWSDEQAAGAALVYLTAWQALTQFGQLKPSVVLITGASGGVGVATTQLATAAGHTVVALSRSPSKRRQLQQLGATLCLDPADPTWPDQVKQFAKVDLAIDNIGGDGFNQLLAVMAHHGKISVVGRLAGPVKSFNTASLFFRRLQIAGVHVGDYSPIEAQQAWKQIVQKLDQTHSRPLIDSVFPFEQLKEAFAKLNAGPMGKVLLRIK